MGKIELVDSVAADTDMSKADVAKVVDAVFKTVAATLGSGNEFAVHGFGSFTVKSTAPRKGRNPKTGEAIDIPAGKKLVFKAAKALKDVL